MEYLRSNAHLLELPTAMSIEHLVVLMAVLLLLTLASIVASNRKDFSKFPSLKLSYLDFLGHMKYLPSRHMRKQIPANAFLLQVMSGMGILHRKQNMVLVWVSNQPFLFISKAETVEELLSTTTTLEKAWSYNMLHSWLGTGLLTSKGDKWKSRRKLLTPSFHFDILKEFLSVFNEQCDILVDILKKETSKEWTDLVNVVTLCSLDIICETTLGVSIGAQKNSKSEYVQAVLRAAEATMGRMMNPLFWNEFIYHYLTPTGRQFRKDLKTLHTFTHNVIKKKKNALKMGADDGGSGEHKKRKALMDLLLDHHLSHSDLTEEDVREEVDTFAFEGHDTTSMGISWTLYLLGLHPEIQEKVQSELDSLFHGSDSVTTQDDLKEMKYLECVIKESLRLYPSVPLIGRQANKNTVLGGHKVPEGTVCMVFQYMLHRDPDVFPNPEVFNPDRFLIESSVKRHPYAFVPFSAGPRNCIGQRFAMMEMKTVISSVLRHFSIKSLDQRHEVIATSDLILRSTNPIRAKFTLRAA